MGTIKKLLGGILPVVIIAAGIAAARYFILTKPKAGMKVRAERTMLVAVMPLERADRVVTVPAAGTVEPARVVDVVPQVSGRIVGISPAVIPGGFLKKGEKIVQIETDDFELALEQKKAGLVQAEHDYALEEGEQEIASQEYRLMNEELPPREKSIVLRLPQRKLAKANLESARAAVEEAKLDLERTTITAPFDSLVREKTIELGGLATASSPVVTLLGIDEYWIRLSVPVDALNWLDIPGYNSEKGSTVKISQEVAWGEHGSREGEVSRLVGELQPEGRMAQILVTVKDPMCRLSEHKDLPHVLVGMYVEVECRGITLPNIVTIPRTALRDGDNVWLMTPENRLEIRPVRVAWRTRDSAFISEGVRSGEQLVVSDLAAPVAGIALRTGNDKAGENKE